MTNQRLPTILHSISLSLIALFTALFTTLATAQIPTLPQEPIPADIAQAINSVMAVNYGSDYDKLRGCTLYHKTETSDYNGEEFVITDSHCIAPIKYQVEEVGGQTRLYLLTSGYIYDGRIGRSSPGIGGLFELYRMGNSWVVSASEPFIFTGGSGRSQLYQFELSKVGDDKYAWTGKHCGSGAGGQSNCLWQMYAPINGSIKKVAEIDSDYYSESYSAGTYHEGTGYVSHDYNAPMTAGFYPLTLTVEKTSVNYRTDKEIKPSSEEKSTYKYNQAKQQFQLVK